MKKSLIYIIATAIILIVLSNCSSFEKGNFNEESRSKSKPWKLDVDIYDKPGWNSFTYQFPLWGAIQKRANDEIVLRFDSADANTINDDFYFEHYRNVVLSSKDGGKSWEEIEPDWEYHIPLKLSDGTLIEVIQKRAMKTKEEKKGRLEKFGLGHLWRDDCNVVWDLWPEEMLVELKAQGLKVWDKKRWPIDSKYHITLPDGVVATHAPTDMIIRKSTDDGKTWQESKAPGLNQFAHFGECFPGSVALPDDTILVPFYASGKEDTENIFGKTGTYILRSVDKGKSWEIINLPECNGSETCLIYHPSGRVIALIRGGNIQSSFSDDGGKTWSPTKLTGMMGYPHSGICLSSGNLLCTYAHRDFPAGIRATLSYDRGESWDVANEKILRDNVLPTSYIGGPGSVQLSDGTIFTFFSLAKVETPKAEDVLNRDRPLTLTPRFHLYISGSRYTENYIRPLGK